MLTISYVSAHFAIRIQYGILAIMALSILSFVLTPAEPVSKITRIGKFEDESFWQVFAIYFPAVILGILAATFSSALGSMLGAPRILQALAELKTVPWHRTFAKKASNDEPRNAIIFTGIVIEIALILGDLNALAVLITMFFLITYGRWFSSSRA